MIVLINYIPSSPILHFTSTSHSMVGIPNVLKWLQQGVVVKKQGLGADVFIYVIARLNLSAVRCMLQSHFEPWSLRLGSWFSFSFELRHHWPCDHTSCCHSLQRSQAGPSAAAASLTHSLAPFLQMNHKSRSKSEQSVQTSIPTGPPNASISCFSDQLYL